MVGLNTSGAPAESGGPGAGLTGQPCAEHVYDASASGAVGTANPLVPVWRELVEDHYSIQRVCYFSEVEHVPGAVYASSRATDDFIWNHAYLHGSITIESVAEAGEWLSDRARGLTIYVDDLSYHAGGWTADYKTVDRETWMVLPPTSSVLPDGVTASRCFSPAEKTQFAGLVGAIFRPDYEACLLRANVAVDGIAKSARLLLHVEGQAVGTGSLYWRSGSLAAIHDVGVLESHRRQGLGTQIVRELLSLAHQEGIENCYLQCEASMESFYTGLGFASVHRRLGIQPKGGPA